MRSLAAAAISFLVLTFAARAGADTPARKATNTAPAMVWVFRDVALHFHPDSSAKFARRGLTYRDQGREASVTVSLPRLREAHRITALLTVRPVPRTDREVFDRYDRAGNIRLKVDGGPDLEVVRFITAYGGRTDHEIDVTQLAPLLTGKRTFVAHIDTWSSPAWTLDLSLRYTPVEDYDNATWAMPADLTDALPPGRHTIRFAIESMRPKDAKGNYGYWRVSAALVGWNKPPRLWRNP